MLDVRRMRILREVARYGSISAAAAALDFTPSAVSQQIKALEREASIALVERGPSRVTLTQAGRVLVEHTDAVLGRLLTAEGELRALGGLEAGTVRLATFPTAGQELVPRAIARLGERHPNIVVELAEAEPEQALATLGQAECDVAVTYRFDLAHAPDPAGHTVIGLADDPLALALPAGHPLATAARVPAAVLGEVPWIVGTPSSPCDEMTHRLAGHFGFTPRTVFRTDDYGIAQGLVAAGLGIVLVPALARQVRPEIAWRRFDEPSLARHVEAVHRRDGLRVPAVAALIEALVAAAAEFGEELGPPPPALRVVG